MQSFVNDFVDAVGQSLLAGFHELQLTEHRIGTIRRVAAPVFKTTGDTRCDVRIVFVEFEHGFGPELIASTVKSVEFRRIVREESKQQCIDVVRIRNREEITANELLETINHRGFVFEAGRRCLDCKPLVNQKGLIDPFLKCLNRQVVLRRRVRMTNERQGCELIGQVFGLEKLITDSDNRVLRTGGVKMFRTGVSAVTVIGELH